MPSRNRGLTVGVTALVALGVLAFAGCRGKNKSEPAPKSAPPAHRPARVDTGRPALEMPAPGHEPPPGGSSDPAGRPAVQPHVEKIEGITMSYAASGQVSVTGPGRDGAELGMTFDSEAMLRNALPTLADSLTDQQLAALRVQLEADRSDAPAAATAVPGPDQTPP